MDGNESKEVQRRPHPYDPGGSTITPPVEKARVMDSDATQRTLAGDAPPKELAGSHVDQGRQVQEEIAKRKQVEQRTAGLRQELNTEVVNENPARPLNPLVQLFRRLRGQ